MIGDKQRFRVLSIDMFLHESKITYILVVNLEHETGEYANIRKINSQPKGFLPLLNNMLEAMGEEPITATTMEMILKMVRERVKKFRNKFVAIDTAEHNFLARNGDDVCGIKFASDKPFHKSFQKIGAYIIQPKS
jgi:hypothetical protein